MHILLQELFGSSIILPPSNGLTDDVNVAYDGFKFWIHHRTMHKAFDEVGLAAEEYCDGVWKVENGGCKLTEAMYLEDECNAAFIPPHVRDLIEVASIAREGRTSLKKLHGL